MLRAVMFVKTPLPHIATHIQCPYRRSALRIHTDGGGPAQITLPGTGVCRVPVRSPGIPPGCIAASGGLLPFPLRGQADFIPPARAYAHAEGGCVRTGDST